MSGLRKRAVSYKAMAPNSDDVDAILETGYHLRRGNLAERVFRSDISVSAFNYHYDCADRLGVRSTRGVVGV